MKGLIVAGVVFGLILLVAGWFCHATAVERAHEIVNDLPSNTLFISKKMRVFIRELTPHDRNFGINGINYIIETAWLERKVAAKRSFFTTDVLETGEIVLCLRLHTVGKLSPDRVEQLEILAGSEKRTFFVSHDFSMYVVVGESMRPSVEISDKRSMNSSKVFFE